MEKNRIPAGKTKGVWIEFFIPSDQPAGIYRGQIEVEAEESCTVAVELEVLALSIPQENHVKTLFHTNYEHMSHYEKGDMPSMYDKYLRYLMEHRICQTDIGGGGYTMESIPGFCDKAFQLCLEGLSTIGIPTVEKKLEGWSTFDEDHLSACIYGLACKSLEAGMDVVSKAVVYDWRIDEPFFVNYKPGQVEDAVNRFSAAIAGARRMCEQNPAFDSDFGRQIIRSVEGVRHIITDYAEKTYPPNNQKLDANGNPYRYNLKEVTLCPKYDGYNDPEQIAMYAQCQERWWYGCNAPGAPFPSYHLDDALYCPRLISWMMARYNIVGNLYWANNIYTEFNTGKVLFLDDPYTMAHQGTGANGEGRILYPGAQYGVDGPVGCMRIKNIREGHQDWEILRATEQIYGKCGSSFLPTLDYLMSSVCDGVKVESVHGSFDSLHESVLRLAAVAAQGILVEAKPEKDGVTYCVRTDLDVTVCEVQTFEQDGWHIFRMPYVCDAWFTLKIGDQLRIPLYQGGGMKILLHEELFDRGAVRADHSPVTINRDEVRREITVDMAAADHVFVELGTTVHEGQTLGLELRTTEPCTCVFYADGYENHSFRITTAVRWNRIEIPTDYSGFETTGIHIVFEQPRKAGLGAVYIHR